MIYLYSGTPGSGKSLHCIQDICIKLKRGGTVMANFPVAIDKIKIGKKKKLGEFIYKDNDSLKVDFLVKHALKNHVKGKESQTMLVIDEAQNKFNPRDYRDTDRKDWNKFFPIHRHLGYDIILITQNDRLLDKQIRCLIEYEIKHRKINNFKTIGMLLPFKTFAAITMWYSVKEKISMNLFIYKKYYSSLYDSYALFDSVKQDIDKLQEPSEC